MKNCSNEFKDALTHFGRQQDVIITYRDDDGNYNQIRNENLNRVEIITHGAMLKSIMKEVDIESRVDIPKGTFIDIQYGILTSNDYEYINMGQYIVKESEYNEDTLLYNLTCYDTMLVSMVDYKDMEITYPISVRSYLTKICQTLGIKFANENDKFANFSKMVQGELYLDLGYTFRDVLDEIAQVVGGAICINASNELEVRYINDTGITIDETYLKDENINFKEKFGAINSIVLSRSAESDNVYIQDEKSIEENGLCELKIKDNQIMNFNNRSEFLPDLLSALGGIEYYINDYESTGIMYLVFYDQYNVVIKDKTYKCLFLNSEQIITQGLEEKVFTEEPEQTETDYTKADKTDQRINQTTLIVDKQNQKIESVITNTTETNQKMAILTQRVDELSSKVSDVADITISGESNQGQVMLEKVNKGYPVTLKVHPINYETDLTRIYPYTNDIGLLPSTTLLASTSTIPTNRTNYDDHLYPYTDDKGLTSSTDLLASESLLPDNRLNRDEHMYPRNLIVDFFNEEKDEHTYYELPGDLLYYSAKIYDEFHMDYNNHTCQIIRRVGSDDTYKNKYPLMEEIVEEFEFPELYTDDGNYTISLLDNDVAYIFVRMMVQNIYTDQFATKVEMESEIKQTAQGIDLSVNKKLLDYAKTTEMEARITITAESINSEVRKKVGKTEVISSINQSAEAITINANKIGLKANNILDIISGNAINLTSKNLTIASNNFNVDKYGNMRCSNGQFDGNGTFRGRIEANEGYFKGEVQASSGTFKGRVEASSGFFKGEVQASSGSFTGSVNATSGTFRGNVYLQNGRELVTYNTSGIQAVRIDRYGMKVYSDGGSLAGRCEAGLVDGKNSIGLVSSGTSLDVASGEVFITGGALYVNGNIYSRGSFPYSLVEKKKNISSFTKKATSIIQNTDVYNFKYKDDETEKNYIGFIIGEGYKIADELHDGKGVDLYSTIGVMWKAIQEQQQMIEELRKEIEKLKGGNA